MQDVLALISALSVLVAIAAIALNNWLAQRRQESQRRTDAAALRAGFIADLELLVQGFEERLRQLTEYKKHAETHSVEHGLSKGRYALYWNTAIFESVFYEASCAQLGRLTENEIRAVITAYRNVTHNFQVVLSMAEIEEKNYLHRVPYEYLPDYAQMLEATLPSLHKALKVLQNGLHSCLPLHPPK